MHAMRPFGRTLAALALAATSLAACSDSTGPVSSIDTETAAAKVAPIAAVFQQSTFESMAFAGEYFGTAPSSGLRAVSELTAALRDAKTRDARAVLLARSAAVEVSAAVVPQEVKGSTYVYDAGQAGYVLDQAATGAPANGFRIVLYAWDVLAGAPASPLNRIGYVDLIDESTASANALRVRVVRDQGSATLANYVITHAATASGETFGLTGSASNATTTVNFNLNGSASGELGAEKVSASFNVSAPTLGYSVAMQTSVDEALEEMSISLAIGYDGHTLTFDESFSPAAEEGEIRYDGQLFATYTGTYDAETGNFSGQYVKPNGDPVTPQEMAAIAGLFERAFDLGNFWSGLLWPVYAFQ